MSLLKKENLKHFENKIISYYILVVAMDLIFEECKEILGYIILRETINCPGGGIW